MSSFNRKSRETLNQETLFGSLSWVLIAFVGSYDGSKSKKDWDMGTLRGIKSNPR